MAMRIWLSEQDYCIYCEVRSIYATVKGVLFKKKVFYFDYSAFFFLLVRIESTCFDLVLALISIYFFACHNSDLVCKLQ